MEHEYTDITLSHSTSNPHPYCTHVHTPHSHLWDGIIEHLNGCAGRVSLRELDEGAALAESVLALDHVDLVQLSEGREHLVQRVLRRILRQHPHKHLVLLV